MTDTDPEYSVDEISAGREVNPLDDYAHEIDSKDDPGYVEINCPSCQYSVPACELVLEGGGVCDGCGRTIKLHVTSHDEYGEWRNVPKHQQEAHR